MSESENQADPFDLREMMANLPQPMQRRVRALRKLQLANVKLEAEFYQKLHELECEYAQKGKPLNAKRCSIVNGEHEPTDEECDFPLLPAAADKEEKPPADAVKSESNDAQPKCDIRGIPDFWLTVFQNVVILNELIEEHDVAILRHLMDVDFELSPRDPMKFSLLFRFSPNEFFTNSVLTKDYFLKCVPDDEAPFEFDGPEIVNCKGCTIDWKPGKNVTVKTVRRKQKHKTKPTETRVVTKQARRESFFNFFSPPQIDEANPDTLDDETREMVNADFEIGQMIRDRIVPRAVLYFTGEAHDELDDEDEEDEMDEDYLAGDDDDDGSDESLSEEVKGKAAARDKNRRGRNPNQ